MLWGPRNGEMRRLATVPTIFFPTLVRSCDTEALCPHARVLKRCASIELALCNCVSYSNRFNDVQAVVAAMAGPLSRRIDELKASDLVAVPVLGPQVRGAQ